MYALVVVGRYRQTVDDSICAQVIYMCTVEFIVQMGVTSGKLTAGSIEHDNLLANIFGCQVIVDPCKTHHQACMLIICRNHMFHLEPFKWWCFIFQLPVSASTVQLL